MGGRNIGHRMIPFGYCMRNGVIETEPTEAETVRKIFQAYLDGKSQRQIAEAVKVPYDGENVWKISYVSRILNHSLYIGTDVYPRLIEPDLFDRVQREKASRCRWSCAIPKEIAFVRSLSACKECGHRLRRYGGNQRAEYWECVNPECSKFPFRLKDRVLLPTILKIVNTVIRRPEFLDNNAPIVSYSPNDEVLRQQNEIRDMMLDSHMDEKIVREKLYQLADVKFGCCVYDNSPRQTERLKSILAGRSKLQTIDIDLLNSCVRRIFVSHSCKIGVEFQNGVLIEERSICV